MSDRVDISYPDGRARVYIEPTSFAVLASLSSTTRQDDVRSSTIRGLNVLIARLAGDAMNKEAPVNSSASHN